VSFNLGHSLLNDDPRDNSFVSNRPGNDGLMLSCHAIAIGLFLSAMLKASVDPVELWLNSASEDCLEMRRSFLKIGFTWRMMQQANIMQMKRNSSSISVCSLLW